jgi:hypothetical protein
VLLIINVNFNYVIFFTKTYLQKNTLGTINSQWSININKLSVQGGTEVYRKETEGHNVPCFSFRDLPFRGSNISPFLKGLVLCSGLNHICFNYAVNSVDVELHPSFKRFIIIIYYFFVCIKLNFFLQFSFLFIIYSLSGYNRNKTRPQRPRVQFWESRCNTKWTWKLIFIKEPQ